MTTPKRSLVTHLSCLAALVATTASSVGAQRQQIPGPDTRRVVVTAFRGDVEGGVKAANAIRDRIQGEFNIRQVMPSPKKDIDATLVNSGFPIDTALSPNDVKSLAVAIRGDEVIDGTVLKTDAGYRISARLFLPRDVALSQPLVTNLETNNLGDAAKQIVSEYDRARKQIPDNQACENGLRENTPAVAIAAARKGIATYPKATIARICLATSYAAMKESADAGSWADSVIAITKVVIDLDKVNRLAYKLQIDAYKQMHDTTNLVSALLGYMNSDLTNATLREQVIAEIIQLGKAHLAVPLAKSLVTENPGVPEHAKLYWQVLRAAKNYKESVPAGIAYVALDTAAADTNYYFRQIQDLAADSNFARAAQLAAEGAKKFPSMPGFLVTQAQNERRSGQSQAAKATLERAIAVDPKVNGANYLLAQISNDLGNVDDAIKYAQIDASDPANKPRDAQLLLGFGQVAYKQGVASKKAEDFKRAVTLLKASDELAQSPEAAFVIAVSGYQSLANVIEDLKTSRSCEEFRTASENLNLVSQYMPRGGRINPEVAKQLLDAVPVYSPFIEGSVKKHCK